MSNKKESVFENIPERTIAPEMKAPIQQGAFAGAELEVVNKQNKIYSIMSGKDEGEYYSFNLPTFADGELIVHEYFKKGVISQKILNENIEEYYCDWPDDEDMKMSLDFGIFMQAYEIDSIYWLNNTVVTANQSLQAKVIEKYQAIVPNLIQRITNLESQPAHNNVKQRQQSNLIEL